MNSNGAKKIYKVTWQAHRGSMTVFVHAENETEAHNKATVYLAAEYFILEKDFDKFEELSIKIVNSEIIGVALDINNVLSL